MRQIAGIIGTWAVAVALAAVACQAQAVNEPASQPAEPAPLGDEAPKAAPRPVEPVPPGDEAEKDRKLDTLLGRWEERNAAVKTIDAVYRRVDRKRGWRNLTEYEGRILLKGPKLACLNLEKIEPHPDPEAKITRRFQERLICTGDEVIWYDCEVRQVVVFPQAAREKSRAFRPWPAPFLLGVEAAQLKAQYTIKLVQEGRDASRIEFIPREDKVGYAGDLWSQIKLFFAGKPQGGGFSRAILDLDRETSLPKALMLTSPDGTESLTYVFKEIKVNAKLPPENFAFQKFQGWRVIRDTSPNAEPDVANRPRGDAGGLSGRPREKYDTSPR